MEIPVFTGDELRPWIAWMENRHSLEEFDELQKLALAYGFIEGEALSWYVKRESWLPFGSWESLKKGLWLRFGKNDDPERIEICLEHERRWKKLRSCTKILEKETTRGKDSSEEKESSEEIQSIRHQKSSLHMTLTPKFDSIDGHIEVTEKATIQEEEIKEDQSIETDSIHVKEETYLIHGSHKVPISALESSHRVCNDPVDVLEQLSLATERNNQSQFQCCLESVNGKNCAYHMFDIMLIKRHRLYNLKKMSLYPKSWMFKFKRKRKAKIIARREHILVHRRLMRDKHPCSNAKVGLIMKETQFQSMSKRKVRNKRSMKSWKFKYRNRCVVADCLSLVSRKSLQAKYHRVQSQEKQRKCFKNWRFKYKDMIRLVLFLTKERLQGNTEATKLRSDEATLAKVVIQQKESKGSEVLLLIFKTQFRLQEDEKDMIKTWKMKMSCTFWGLQSWDREKKLMFHIVWVLWNIYTMVDAIFQFRVGKSQRLLEFSESTWLKRWVDTRLAKLMLLPANTFAEGFLWEAESGIKTLYSSFSSLRTSLILSKGVMIQCRVATRDVVEAVAKGYNKTEMQKWNSITVWEVSIEKRPLGGYYFFFLSRNVLDASQLEDKLILGRAVLISHKMSWQKLIG